MILEFKALSTRQAKPCLEHREHRAPIPTNETRAVGTRSAFSWKRPGLKRFVFWALGEDRGLMRETAKKLVPAAAGDASDPFRVSLIEAGMAKSDPARLED